MPPFVDAKSFVTALQLMGAAPPSAGGVVVNIGAKWDGHRRTDKNNRDYAWEFVSDYQQLSIVGFEGDPTTYNSTIEVMTMSTKGRFRNANLNPQRARLHNEFVYPPSICRRLKAVGVPVPAPAPHVPTDRDRLLLLKLDIDSADVPVMEAILGCGHQPLLVFVEFNHWLALPARFAALDAAALPTTDAALPALKPRYGAGYRGRNDKWPCMGGSLRGWAAALHPLDYRLLSTDRASNALFVSHSAWQKIREQHPAVSRYAGDRPCNDMNGTMSSPALRRDAKRRYLDPAQPLRAYAAAVAATVDERCRATQTPYTLSFDGGHDGVQHDDASASTWRACCYHAWQARKTGVAAASDAAQYCRCDKSAM